MSIYGPDLPVWALLASGSTGGVRRTLHPYRLYRSCPTLPQIAYWLSSYPLGKSAAVLLVGVSFTLPPLRRHQVACTTSHNTPEGVTCAIHRERIESCCR